MEFILRLLLLLIFSLSSLFASVISKDVNGGSGVFLGLTYLELEKTVVVAADSGGVKALRVKDSTLELLSTSVLTGNAKDVVQNRDGNIVYVAADNSGLYVLDYSDPLSPQIITSFSTIGQSIDLGIDNENSLLAMAEDSVGVRVYDISSNTLPVEIKFIETKKQVLKVFVKKDRLIVGYLSGEVDIYDISSEPVKKFTLTNFLSINQLIEFDGNLAILDGTVGLFIYDIKKADLPILLGAFPLHGGVGLSIDEKSAYISTVSQSLYKLNLTEVEKIKFEFIEPVNENINELVVIDKKLIGSRLDKSIELLVEVDSSSCVDEVTFGKNPANGNWSKFYSGCDVPTHWLKSTEFPEELSSQELSQLTSSYINSLGSGWHLLGTSVEISDLSIFDNAKAVWQHGKDGWSAYSSKNSINGKLNRDLYPNIEKIRAGNGFWVQND